MPSATERADKVLSSEPKMLHFKPYEQHRRNKTCCAQNFTVHWALGRWRFNDRRVSLDSIQILQRFKLYFFIYYSEVVEVKWFRISWWFSPQGTHMYISKGLQGMCPSTQRAHRLWINLSDAEKCKKWSAVCNYTCKRD